MKKVHVLFIPLFFLILIASAQTVTFNGVANNSTDNTAALNSAFQQGSTVIIPAGSNYYKIAGTVNIPAGKTIVFNSGAKFNVTGNLKGSNTFINAGETEIFKNTSEINGTWSTNYIYAKWTGAVGNGTTDDYEALSLFFKLIGITENDQARLEVNKEYYIKDQIFYTVIKEINLDGRGSKITRKYADVTNPSGEMILTLTGEVFSTKSLTSNLIKGQRTLKVNDNSGLTTQMGVVVLSNELYGKEYINSGNWHYHDKGLLSKITSISGTTITIADSIPYNFDYTDVVEVRFFKVYPVTIKNLNFASKNITGNYKLSQLRLDQLFNVNVENIICNPLGYSGINPNAIYNGSFKNIDLIRPVSGGDDNTFGVYGITPTLNVNCTYDNIYGRAVTHGIAFTAEPSYNVLVKNSDFQSSTPGGNGVDSHSSFWVKFLNCTIYGAQGNWGTFIFDSCEMHEVFGNGNVWNERAGSATGGLYVVAKNCNFYTTDDGNNNTILFQRQVTTGNATNQYSIFDNNFYLENDNSFITDAVSPGPATDIKTFRIENNNFYGNGTLRLPGNYNSTPTTQGGNFKFINNNYGKIYWLSPPLDQFETIEIIGNEPVNSNNSDFWIMWDDNSVGNIYFTENVFVGACFWIQGCSGNIVFNNNDIYNDQHKSSSSWKNRNYIFNNNSTIFENNDLHNTYWTLTGNQRVEGNISNGNLQPSEPNGNWQNINNPTSALDIGLTLAGVDDFTFICKGKMNDISTNEIQYLVGSSESKLRLGFNPSSSAPPFRGTIKNVNNTVISLYKDRFYMDYDWHTYVLIMENGILTAYMDGIPLLNYDVSAVYQQISGGGTIQIGGSNTSNLWKGPINLFAIYDRPLSLEESNSVIENPNTTLSGEIYKLAISNETPVAHWKFDETSGSSALDNSGNNYTGTLVNGPVWKSGKISNALQFDGVNDRVECGTNSGLDMGIQDFTISTWVKMGSNQDSYPTFLSKGGNSTSTSGYWFYLSGSYLKLAMGDGISRVVASSGTVNIKDNVWHHVAVTINRFGNATFFVDGLNKGDYDVSQLAGKLISNSTKTLSIASMGTSSTSFLNGLLDDTRIYTRALSTEEIADLANLSQSNNLISHWAFDENSGTIAIDSTENQFNGTLVSGPIWNTGIKGNSLKFDGMNDKVECGSNNSLDMGTGDISVSAWVKMGSNQLAYPTILAKGGTSNSNAGYWFYISGSKIKFTFGDGTQRISSNSNTVSIFDNTWHHIAVSVDRNGDAVFYLDGINSGTFDVSSFNGKNISNPNRVLNIGTTGGSTSLLNGYLDDVKIFNKALIQTEINELIQINSSQNDQGDFISYWAFDESSGTNTADFGSNNYDGTLVNGPLWTTGQVGNSLQFDGVNDIVNCGTGANLDMGTDDWSVSAWVKLGSDQNSYPTILSKGATSNTNEGYWFYISGSKIKFSIGDGSQRLSTYSETVNITDDTWHHIAVTINRNGNAVFYVDGISAGTYDVSSFNGKNITNPTRMFTIGATGSSTTFLNGKIDEVQIYRRVLTSSEIGSLADALQNYNLISHWTFDENSGNIALDSSINVVNDGILTNDPLRKTGIKGNALEFDGLNTRVECGTDNIMDMGTGDFTISSWVKMGSNQVSYPTIVSKGGTSNSDAGYWFYISDSKIKFTFGDGTERLSSYSEEVNVTDNTWHHIAVVIDRDDEAVFYLDGVNSGTIDISSFNGKDISNPQILLTIGSANTSTTTFFSGKIDDLKIFNSALSFAEITALANVPQNYSLLMGVQQEEIQKTHFIDAFPNPFKEQLTLRISSEEYQNGNVYIYDLTGVIVKTFNNKALTTGNNEFYWDGRNDNGAFVKPGMYIIKVITNSKIDILTIIKM